LVLFNVTLFGISLQFTSEFFIVMPWERKIFVTYMYMVSFHVDRTDVGYSCSIFSGGSSSTSGQSQTNHIAGCILREK